METGFLYRFIVRWGVCTLGLWIAAALLGSRLTYDDSMIVLIIAGLILAFVNSIIRPFFIFLSIPALLLTLGLFMLVINALMILFVAWLYEPLEISGFWSALLAGFIIGVVNFLVSIVLESSKQTKGAKKS